MVDEHVASRRSLLAAVGAGVAGRLAGVAGCSGVLGGGGPSYECFRIVATGQGDFLAFEYEIEYGQVNAPAASVTGNSSGSAREQDHWEPDDCTSAFFDPEEHPRVRTPIVATMTVDSDADVSESAPVEFALVVEGETVDSAEATGVGETVTLEHRP